MFETLAIHYRDQGSGLPPWEEDWTGGPHDEEYEEGEEHQEGDDMPEGEMPDELEEFFGQAPSEHQPKPIEARTSEAEKLYANLLMKTDFERDFIEDMLEFEPDEESEMRIDELREKRREMKQLAQGSLPPQTTTILV